MRKKNKILTLMFACLPGAGHMYLGFMKMGLSFMILFFGIGGLAILVSELIYFLTGPIIMILPVIWFYAFFDCINKNGASDEEFASYQDHFLFSDMPELQTIDWKFHFGFLTSRAPRIAIGFIILISGVSMFCRNLLNMIDWYYWEQFAVLRNILYSLFDRLPQLVISVAIIALGFWLIRGKSKVLKREVREIKALAQEVQTLEKAPVQEVQETEPAPIQEAPEAEPEIETAEEMTQQHEE